MSRVRIPSSACGSDGAPTTGEELREREATRIRDALGEKAVRIELVGPTSVPGLAAKPVVDIVLFLIASQAAASAG